MTLTRHQAAAIRGHVDRLTIASRRAAGAVHAGMASQHERAAETERAELEALLVRITRDTPWIPTDDENPELTGPQARALHLLRTQGPLSERQMALRLYGTDGLTGNLRKPLTALLERQLIAPAPAGADHFAAWKYTGPDHLSED